MISCLAIAIMKQWVFCEKFDSRPDTESACMGIASKHIKSSYNGNNTA